MMTSKCLWCIWVLITPLSTIWAREGKESVSLPKRMNFWKNSTGISIIMDINEMGSAMIVVEDNSKQSIGQRSKKDDDRQDPSL